MLTSGAWRERLARCQSSTGPRCQQIPQAHGSPPGQLYWRERKPSPGFRHSRMPGHQARLLAGESWDWLRRGHWAASAVGPWPGPPPPPLTWMIRSPSRIRPSLAAMLLGFTCKAHASWGPGTLHSDSLLVAKGSLTLAGPKANYSLLACSLFSSD